MEFSRRSGRAADATRRSIAKGDNVDDCKFCDIVNGDGDGLTFAETYYTRPSRTELESVAEKIKEEIEQRALADADKPHH